MRDPIFTPRFSRQFCIIGIQKKNLCNKEVMVEAILFFKLSGYFLLHEFLKH